jgi:hypothetical protein
MPASINWDCSMKLDHRYCQPNYYESLNDAHMLSERPNGLEFSGPAKLLSTENRALAWSAAAS